MGGWKEEEMAKLVELVEGSGEVVDWIKIAAELGRLPSQCESKYQFLQTLSPDLRQWTADQEQRLMDAVRAFGKDSWEEIAQFVGGGISPNECKLKRLYFYQFRRGLLHLTLKKRLAGTYQEFTFKGPKMAERIEEWNKLTEEEKHAIDLAGRNSRVQALLRDATRTNRPKPKYVRLN